MIYAATTFNGDPVSAVAIFLFALALLAWCFVPALIAGAMTTERGHGYGIGFVVGFLFGWIGLLFCLVMPYRQDTRYNRNYYGRGRRRRR